MDLENRFIVPVPPDRAWDILTDVARITPCLPGAALESVDGEEFYGRVRVRVGPVTTAYRGRARFAVLDRAAQHLVLEASGRDDRGQGGAAATIAVRLAPDSRGTVVDVVTKLALTGKVAQLGGGVIREVSGHLVDEFVRRLETEVLGGGHAPPAHDSDEINLLRFAAPDRLRRPAAAALVGAFVGWALVTVGRRLRRRAG